MYESLPVCWCSDPGTYALEVAAMPGVGALEDRWWWLRADGRRTAVVARCRAHAGPFAEEVADGSLVPCRPVPIDAAPYDVALPIEP